MRPVHKFVEALQRMRSTMESSQSPIGNQLEKMRDGTQGISSANPDRLALIQQEWAFRVLIWDALPAIQRQLLLDKNHANGWEYKPRIVLEADLVVNIDYGAMLMTRQGEEVWPEQEELFPPPKGHRVVKSPRPLYPTNAELAKTYGMTVRQVRTEISAAYDAIEAHPLYKTLPEASS